MEPPRTETPTRGGGRGGTARGGTARMPGRVRAAVDRVPTRWFTLGAAGILLLASAAFGGLDDAPVATLPVVAAGEVIAGEQLDITVERAVLIDDVPEALLFPDDDQRVVAVVVVIENNWDRPVPATNGFGYADNLRLAGVDGIADDRRPDGVARLDDATVNAVLQPGMPVELGFFWLVDAGAVQAEDAVDALVLAKSYVEVGWLLAGDRYDEPTEVAVVPLALRDVGDGTS